MQRLLPGFLLSLVWGFAYALDSPVSEAGADDRGANNNMTTHSAANNDLHVWCEGQAVMLIRHALAPGTGDPANFERGDCGTQRNLSDAGRAQARAIGQQLAGVLGDDRQAEVYSSAWCRCIETSELLDAGSVTLLPSLDSLFRDYSERAPRTAALTTWIEERLAEPVDLAERPPAILVTHQFNISALTGGGARSGEIVVVTLNEDSVEVLGKIDTPVP